jgi:hypothetical protein
MKHHSVSEPAPPPPARTLQDVLDLVGANPDLSETRRRDLRSPCRTSSTWSGATPTCPRPVDAICAPPSSPMARSPASH